MKCHNEASQKVAPLELNVAPNPAIQMTCPRPVMGDDFIRLAHGGGGKLSERLIEAVFRPAFGSGELERGHDAALLDVSSGALAMSTDSFVVSPLFFPGGDIGKLAVYGTVNDLAMAGAEALYLSVAFILEEGLEMEILRRVVDSLAETAAECGVQIVCGDTKVVEKGKGDGIFINTTGIGRRLIEPAPVPQRIRPGDAIIVSGDLGRHGVAVLAAREGLEFEPPVESDCAWLFPAVAELIEAGIEVHCLRDLTRGGLSSALYELTASAGVDAVLEEISLKTSESVSSAVEILGLDPWSLANEGRFLVVIPQAQAESAVKTLQSFMGCEEVSVVGTVTDGNGSVFMQTAYGSKRLLDYPLGEQLPRIC